MGLEPVRLEGPRVVVRSTTPDDAPRYAAYFDRNRAHLEPWEPARDADFYTEAHWVERLRSYECELAGNVNLLEIIQRAPVWRARVGYSLDATKEGRGLMSEALGLVVRYAFEVLNLKRLLAGYVPHNARSAAVLARAGFVREGYYHDYLFVGGRWHDHIETSLINPAWRVPELP
jgi:ribosomal-protein-alanine N-acetyltransferase